MIEATLKDGILTIRVPWDAVGTPCDYASRFPPLFFRHVSLSRPVVIEGYDAGKDTTVMIDVAARVYPPRNHRKKKRQP